MKKSFFRKKHSAFTLTEIAIVVGIVGVIVAGIWTAASYVLEQQRISRLTKDVQYIVAKTQSLMANNSGGLNFGCIPDNCGAGTCPPLGAASPPPPANASTAAAVQAGIFPTDMLTGNNSLAHCNPAAGNPCLMVQSPWSSVSSTTNYAPGYVEFGTQIFNECSGGNHTTYYIRFYGNIPADACTKMLMSDLQGWVNQGLYAMYATDAMPCGNIFGTTPKNYTTIPIGGCPVPGLNLTSISDFCAAAASVGAGSFILTFEWPPQTN